MKKHHLFLAVAAAFTLIQTAAVTVFAAVPPSVHDVSRMLRHSDGTVFPIGSYNARNVDHFTGDSYVAPLSKSPVPVANVTFVRGAHTHWHVHHGTSQTLLAVSGRGYYQIDGQPPRQLLPGQSVTIPTGARHWHGAAPGEIFQHIAVMEPVKGAWTQWFEAVDDPAYEALPWSGFWRRDRE